MNAALRFPAFKCTKQPGDDVVVVVVVGFHFYSVIWQNASLFGDCL